MGGGSQTEVEYRAAWARNYLKNAGLVENSGRAIWALTAEGLNTHEVDASELVREVQRAQREKRRACRSSGDGAGESQGTDDGDWREDLLEVLRDMTPVAFERLCQRLLRESGFIEVEVTGRSGDGGIDGHGIIRLGGLISFNVLFQCKRYKSSVGPDAVRDFRGAMIGRADKGVVITTSNFTREARREATRDGAPPVDLIDGDLLVEKLKDLQLGVKTRMVERVEIDPSWFELI